MDYSKITLGEMLSSENETIKRNAIAVLKVLQKEKTELSLPKQMRCQHHFIEKRGVMVCEYCNYKYSCGK